MQPSSVKNYSNLEKEMFNSPVPINWQSTSSIPDENEDFLFDITSIPPNPELEKLLDEFCPPGQHTSDWKIFSPLHSQMQSELGNSYFYNSLTGDTNNNQQVIPFQYGTNADDSYDFLSSVLTEPDNPMLLIKESNSCSESEGEVTQGQVSYRT